MDNWEDKMNKILSVAKPCPFCNSTKLYISHKTNGHICVYCKNCLTYGPRVLEHGSLEDCKYIFWDYEESVRRWNERYFKKDC